MSDNIEVVVRVRPPLPREEGETLHWKVTDNPANSLTQITAHDKSAATFSFDKVFDSNASNNAIFNRVMQPIVDGALNGINGTVFAYGQTSSGKTHTMMGSSESPGIIPLTIQSIFKGIEDTPDRQYLIRASYMEIYNEQIADLLLGRSNIPGNKGLAVREDTSGNIYVVDLKEECVTDEAKLLSMMHRGNRNKQMGCTNMNDHSSRSHTIFRIIVESQTTIDEDSSLNDASSDDVAVTVSHLNLVDLAGSENAAQTGATGDRLKEGGFINKSLFMLGRVIAQLSDGESFINFRDSKLTRILQCSLGGNARTAIICTITPASLDQTHSTLRFASRAKNIKNKPVVNEVLSEAALLKRYSKEIKQLQLALEAERQSNKADEVIQVKEKLDAVEQMNEDLKNKVRTLNEKLVTSSTSRTPRKKTEDKAVRRRTWAAPAVKNRATMLPLELASINAEFSHPFAASVSAFHERVASRRFGLPKISETESISECSFNTALDEFNDINSSIMKRLDQSFATKHDLSPLDQSAASDVFTPPSPSFRRKVSFASPSMAIVEEASALPSSVSRRKRKGSCKYPSIEPPVKAFRDAEAQTDTSLLPKMNLLASPRTPHRRSPVKVPSSPVKEGLATPQGETPRKILRSRIEKLNECLQDKDSCVSDLREQLAELQDLHEFVEADFVFREESLLAKLDCNSDDDVVASLKSKVASLTRSLQDSELLLLDANKRLAEQSQQFALSSLNVDDLTRDNKRLSADSAQLASLKQRATALAAENNKLKRELSEQQGTVVSMTKDKNDFDMMLELKLQQQHQTEHRLRESLQEAWDELSRREGDAAAVQLRVERASELETQIQRLQVQLNELAPLKMQCEEQHQKIVQLEALVQEQQQSMSEAERAMADVRATGDALQQDLALRDAELLQLKSSGAELKTDSESDSPSSVVADAAALQSRCAELEKTLQLHQAREAEVAVALSKLSQLRGVLAFKAEKESDLLAQVEHLQSLAEADRCSDEKECEKCKLLMEEMRQLSNCEYQVEGLRKEDQREACATDASTTDTEMHTKVSEKNASGLDERETDVVRPTKSSESNIEPVIASDAENVLSCNLFSEDCTVMDTAVVALGSLRSDLVCAEPAELGNLTSELTGEEREKGNKVLLAQLEATISSTRKEAEELRTELSFSANKIVELEADLNESNRLLVIVTAEKDALAEKMEEALQSLQNEVKGRALEKKSLEVKLEAATEACLTKAINCSVNKTLKEQKCVEVQTEVAAKINTQEGGTSEQSETEKLTEFEDASLQVVRLRVEIGNLKVENKNLCLELEEIESLNLNYLTMKNEVEELKEEIERLSLLKKDLSEASVQAREMSLTEVDVLQGTLKELEKQNEKLTKEVSSLETELCAAQKELSLKAAQKELSLKADPQRDNIKVSGTLFIDSEAEPESLSGAKGMKVLGVAVPPSYGMEREATTAANSEEIKPLEVGDSALNTEPEDAVAKPDDGATGLVRVPQFSGSGEQVNGADVSWETVETLKTEIKDKNDEILTLQAKVTEMLTIIDEMRDKSKFNDMSDSIKLQDEKANGTECENCCESTVTGRRLDALKHKENEVDQRQNLEIVPNALYTMKDELNQKKLELEPQDILSEGLGQKLEKEEQNLFPNSTSSAEQKLELVGETASIEQTTEIVGNQMKILLQEIEELKIKKEELQNIQQETKELMQENKELQSIQQEAEELKMKKHELQNIKLEIAELKEKKEELQVMQQKALELEEKNAELQGIQQGTEELLKIKKEELEDIQRKIEELKVEKEELQSIQHEIGEIQKLQEELEAIKRENETLQKQMNELLCNEQNVEEIKEQKEKLLTIQQDMNELKEQREELFQEVSELSDRRRELQHSVSGRRCHSTLGRRVSSAPSARDELCDSVLSMCGGDDSVLIRGSVCHNPTLANVSHRLLQSLSVLEDSLLMAAPVSLAAADSTAASHDRTEVVPEELTVDQLSDIRDQLLSLQRALLAASQLEAAGSLVADCAELQVYAECEVVVQTWALLEAFTCEYYLSTYTTQHGSLLSITNEKDESICSERDMCSAPQLLAPKIEEFDGHAKIEELSEEIAHLKDENKRLASELDRVPSLTSEDTSTFVNYQELIDHITVKVEQEQSFAELKKCKSPSVEDPLTSDVSITCATDVCDETREEAFVCASHTSQSYLDASTRVSKPSVSLNTTEQPCETANLSDYDVTMAVDLLKDSSCSHTTLVVGSGLSLQDEMRMASMQDSIQTLTGTPDRTSRGELGNVSAAKEVLPERDDLSYGSSCDGSVCLNEVLDASQTGNRKGEDNSEVTENVCAPIYSEGSSFPNFEDCEVASEEDVRNLSFTPVHPAVHARLLNEKDKLCDRVEALLADLDDVTASLEEKMDKIGEKEQLLQEQSLRIEALEKQLKDRNLSVTEAESNNSTAFVRKTECSILCSPETSLTVCTDHSVSKFNDSGVVKSYNDSPQLRESSGDHLHPVDEPSVKNSSGKDNCFVVEDLKQQLAEANLVVEEMHCLRWRVSDLEEQKLALTKELALLRATHHSHEKMNDENMGLKGEVQEDMGNEITIACEKSSLEEEPCTSVSMRVVSETQNTVDSVEVVAAEGSIQPCEDEDTVELQDSVTNIPTLSCSLSTVGACADCATLKLENKVVRSTLLRKKFENIHLSNDRKNAIDKCERLADEILLLKQSEEMLKSELESLTNIVSEKELLYSRKCSDFERQEETIAKLRAEIVTVGIEHRKMVDELQKKLCAKETEFTEAEKQIAQKDSSKDSHIDRLLAELAVKNENLQLLCEQVSTAKNELAKARQTNEDLASLCETCAVKLSRISSIDPNMPILSSTIVGNSNTSELSLMTDSIDYLVDKFLTVHKESEKMKDDMQNLRQTVNRKGTDLAFIQETHNEEIKKILALLDDKEKEKEGAVQEERRLRDECEVQFRHQLESKRKQLQQLEEASTELEQEMKLKENNIENMSLQLKEEEMKVSQLQSDLLAVRSEMRLLSDDNDKRKLKIKELTEELLQIRESSVQLAEAQKCLEEAWTTIEELKLEASQISGQKEGYEEELKREKEKSNSLQHGLDFLSEKKDDLESKNTLLKEDVNRLTEAVEKHEFELSEKESKFAALVAEHSMCHTVMAEKDTKLCVLQTSLSSFEQKLLGKSEKCDILAMNLAAREKDLVKTQQQLNDLVKEHSRCEEKIDAVNTELKHLNVHSEVTELKLKLFEKEQENVTLSSECDKRVRQLQASVEEVIREKEAAVAHLAQKLEEGEAKITSLEMECRELSVKHSNVLALPKALYEVVAEDQKKTYIEDLVRLHQHSGGMLEVVCSNVPDRSEEIKDMQRQVSELKEEVQEKETRCKQLDEELDDVVQHYKNRIATYQSDMAGMPAKILALGASNDELTTENKKLTTKLNRLQHENQRLESSLVQLQNESKSTDVSVVGKEEVKVADGPTAEQLAEFKKCLQELDEKESKCRELEDAVQYYEQQIPLFKSDRKNLLSQLQKLQSENKSKLDECVALTSRITSLEMKVQSEHEENERLQTTLQETQRSTKKLEDELSIIKEQKRSGHITPDNGGGMRSSCMERAVREQKAAQFEDLCNADKEIKELREKLHFAETKAARYLDELRRVQNAAPLDSTVCQLRSSGSASTAGGVAAAKPPPIVPLSSSETSNTKNAEKDSEAFSYEIGSHMVLSSQVLQLKREVYQLEKMKVSLESENKSMNLHLSHYKNKAQQWKTSSLAHQKAAACRRDEVERLKKMLETSEKVTCGYAEKSHNENCTSQSATLSEHSSYQSDSIAQDSKPRDVLKDLNSFRSGGNFTDEIVRKNLKASENIPPSDAPVSSLRDLTHSSSHQLTTPWAVEASGTCSKVSSVHQSSSSSSKPSTLSATIIKRLSTENAAPHQLATQSSSVHSQLHSTKRSVTEETTSESASALSSLSNSGSSSQGRELEGPTPASSGRLAINIGPREGGRGKSDVDVKYYRPKREKNYDEDCKTQ
ncbi:Kinesin motor domain [Trinorchestia longiramus]|nr:Kinesin motor domain [Trinorchestia longiramus]